MPGKWKWKFEDRGIFGLTGVGVVCYSRDCVCRCLRNYFFFCVAERIVRMWLRGNCLTSFSLAGYSTVVPWEQAVYCMYDLSNSEDE